MESDRTGSGAERRLKLSGRHCQVLALVGAGLSDKEIAHSLDLSKSTVKTYLSRVYRAHGFKNRAQAAAAFVSCGEDPFLAVEFDSEALPLTHSQR